MGRMSKGGTPSPRWSSLSCGTSGTTFTITTCALLQFQQCIHDSTLQGKHQGFVLLVVAIRLVSAGKPVSTADVAAVPADVSMLRAYACYQEASSDSNCWAGFTKSELQPIKAQDVNHAVS